MSLPGSYEKRHHKLAPIGLFYRRTASNAAFAFMLIAASLAAGMAGYRYFENYQIIDAFLSASMILSGMGPIGDIKSDGGKIFAGLYAIYSGVVIIAATGIILAPLMHRLLHKFHMQDGESEQRGKGG